MAAIVHHWSVELSPERLSAVPHVLSRPIHAYWLFLSPYFRDILLPPQRRLSDAAIYWSWTDQGRREVPSATELTQIRDTLSASALALQDATANFPSRREPDELQRQALLRELAERLAQVVARLNQLPDAALAEYVCRTGAGLRLHSWGAAQPGTPRSPEPDDDDVPASRRAPPVYSWLRSSWVGPRKHFLWVVVVLVALGWTWARRTEPTQPTRANATTALEDAPAAPNHEPRPDPTPRAPGAVATPATRTSLAGGPSATAVSSQPTATRPQPSTFVPESFASREAAPAAPGSGASAASPGAAGATAGSGGHASPRRGGKGAGGPAAGPGGGAGTDATPSTGGSPGGAGGPTGTGAPANLDSADAGASGAFATPPAEPSSLPSPRPPASQDLDAVDPGRDLFARDEPASLDTPPAPRDDPPTRPSEDGRRHDVAEATPAGAAEGPAENTTGSGGSAPESHSTTEPSVTAAAPSSAAAQSAEQIAPDSSTAGESETTDQVHPSLNQSLRFPPLEGQLRPVLDRIVPTAPERADAASLVAHRQLLAREQLVRSKPAGWGEAFDVRYGLRFTLPLVPPETAPSSWSGTAGDATIQLRDGVATFLWQASHLQPGQVQVLMTDGQVVVDVRVHAGGLVTVRQDPRVESTAWIEVDFPGPVAAGTFRPHAVLRTGDRLRRWAVDVDPQHPGRVQLTLPATHWSGVDLLAFIDAESGWGWVARPAAPTVDGLNRSER